MELIVLMGIPGSGKSTLAGEYADRGYAVHASDAIRAELYGDEATQGRASEVFDVLIKRLRADLKAGRSCVMDASNLGRRHRMAALNTLSRYVEKKTCVMALAAPEVCMARNARRQRTAPEDRLYDMLCAFEAPYDYEGWDAIVPRVTGAPYVFPRAEAEGFSQATPYHSLTLGAHLDAVRDYCAARGWSEAVREAAWYHDIGKLYTRRFVNHRGEPTEIAHYYGHESYGAYLYLCEKAAAALAAGRWPEAIYVANLINWHMRMLHIWQLTPAAEAKDRRLMGAGMYADLMRLHEADMAAH